MIIIDIQYVKLIFSGNCCYLSSIEKACVYVSQDFERSIDFNFYKNIHHIACSHFQGKLTNTLVDQATLDNFRKDQETHCYTEIPHGKDYLNNLIIMAIFDKADSGCCKISKEERITAEEKCQKFEAEWDNFKQKIENELEKIKQKYHFQRSLGSLERVGNERVFHYTNMDEKFYFDNIEKMLKNYQEMMHELHIQTLYKITKAKANTNEIKIEYQKEALKNIACLYSELEWLHPWIDGQGRSDLILLSYLLTREGINPASDSR